MGLPFSIIGEEKRTIGFQRKKMNVKPLLRTYSLLDSPSFHKCLTIPLVQECDLARNVRDPLAFREKGRKAPFNLSPERPKSLI